MNVQTLELDAQAALGVINGVLPIIEAAGVAGGPAGLAISGAAALIPLLEKIPVGGVLTVDGQAALWNRIQNIIEKGFSAPEWQRRLAIQGK